MADMEISGDGDRTAALSALVHQCNLLSTDAHYAIYGANSKLSKLTIRDAEYVKGREDLNKALAYLTKAKWYLGRACGTYRYIAPQTWSLADCENALVWFKCARDIAVWVQTLAQGTSATTLPPEPAITLAPGISANAEIVFADDAPIVPSICPIVVLQGTSRDMGRQYVEQVVEIFGSWIFEQIAARSFVDDELDKIRIWESYLLTHTPEIVEMARGWVEGAQGLGIALNYWQAIQLWTGHFDPIFDGILPHGVRDLAMPGTTAKANRASSSYLGGLGGRATRKNGDTDEPANVETCSGCCAWGNGTSDGSLIVGATTDHDCTFQATVVAYPDTGYSFVYTPFSVTGFIPNLGQYYFAGHPGMNDQGLAYVHHGGGLHALEPCAYRGYGLRRGASTFHNLRFARSSAEALTNELSWPIGDVGSVLGSVGGFYADKCEAYVLEGRVDAEGEERPVVRSRASDENGRTFDFLYANNNSIHPRSGKGFLAPPQGYQYNAVEGWFAAQPFTAYPSSDAVGTAAALSTRSSQGRNRYMFEALKCHYGSLDLSGMVEIFRTGAPERCDANGTPLTRQQIEVTWASGANWPSSTTHRLNAFTGIMVPDHGDKGLYMGCIGPGSGRVLMHTPGHGYSYFEETNEFWQIRLASSPLTMAGAAAALARELSALALSAVDACRVQLVPAAAEMLDRLCAKASTDLENAEMYLAHGEATSGNDVAIISRALRGFTRTQVWSQKALRELSDGGYISWEGLHDRGFRANSTGSMPHADA